MSSFFKYLDNGARVLCVWSKGMTEPALNMLEKHIKYGLVNPQDYASANLVYRGPDYNDDTDDPNQYQLKFITADGKNQLWISGLAASYDGAGPRGAVTALRWMDFKVDEREVFELPQGEVRNFFK